MYTSSWGQSNMLKRRKSLACHLQLGSIVASSSERAWQAEGGRSGFGRAGDAQEGNSAKWRAAKPPLERGWLYLSLSFLAEMELKRELERLMEPSHFGACGEVSSHMPLQLCTSRAQQLSKIIWTSGQNPAGLF